MQYHGGFFFYSSMPAALKTTHSRHKPEQVEGPVLSFPTYFLKGIKVQVDSGTLCALARPAVGPVLGHCACMGKELFLLCRGSHRQAFEQSKGSEGRLIVFKPIGLEGGHCLGLFCPEMLHRGTQILILSS